MSQNQQDPYSIIDATIQKIFTVIIPLLSAASGFYFVESSKDKSDENEP